MDPRILFGKRTRGRQSQTDEEAITRWGGKRAVWEEGAWYWTHDNVWQPADGPNGPLLCECFSLLDKGL